MTHCFNVVRINTDRTKYAALLQLLQYLGTFTGIVTED